MTTPIAVSQQTKTVKRGYKFRIWPTEEQKEIFEQWFGCCRSIYNNALEMKMKGYKRMVETYGPTPGKENPRLRKEWWDLFNRLGWNVRLATKIVTDAKDEPLLHYLKEPDANALGQEIRNLEKAYKRFTENLKKGMPFKQAGHPKFKSRKDKQSFHFKVGSKSNGVVEDIKQKTIDGQKIGYLKIPKIGWMKTTLHRPIEGERCSSGTISKTKTGEYYITLLREVEAPESIKAFGPGIGIDLGIDKDHEGYSFATLSNGEKLSLGVDLDRHWRRLKKAQKKLKRMKGGKKGQKQSQNYKKQQLKVAKIHQDVTRQREYAHYMIVDHIIKLRPEFIAIEDLSIKNMSASAKGTIEEPGSKVKQKAGLNRSILSMGWGSFLLKLKTKCEASGIQIHQVGRFFASSQICSSCGEKNELLKKNNLRTWTCSCCGSVHDRDTNAAINILNKGVEIRKKSIKLQ